jgi:hypothetical protein
MGAACRALGHTRRCADGATSARLRPPRAPAQHTSPGSLPASLPTTAPRRAAPRQDAMPLAAPAAAPAHAPAAAAALPHELLARICSILPPGDAILTAPRVSKALAAAVAPRVAGRLRGRG